MPTIRTTSTPQPIPLSKSGDRMSLNNLTKAMASWFSDMTRLKQVHPLIDTFESTTNPETGEITHVVTDRIPLFCGLHTSQTYTARIHPYADGDTVLKTESTVANFRYLKSTYWIVGMEEEGSFVVVDESEFELDWWMRLLEGYVVEQLSTAHQSMINGCAKDISGGRV
ncbi:hypothetical protein BCR33DRAFT_721141, partial [Rhizoclosmatium globosum]